MVLAGKCIGVKKVQVLTQHFTTTGSEVPCCGGGGFKEKALFKMEIISLIWPCYDLLVIKLN